ncbi:MAG: cell filamentation protein Fic [Colwellia sp.]|nr:cell filamentation protein Fic [Colwellia sp.]
MTQLIFAKDTSEAKKFSKAVAQGELKRIRQGIYTDAAWEDIPKLLHNKWYKIIGYLYPSAVVSHATAVSLLPENKVVYITAPVKIRKKIQISDLLTVEVLPGDVEHLKEPFQPNSFRSSPTRYLLENLQISHKDVAAPKSLGKAWVEQELCRLLERYGERELNRIREEARANFSVLKMEKEFQALERLISAILSTQPIDVLSTKRAISVAKKEPFDLNRVEIFENLAKYLRQCEFASRPYQYNSSSWRNLSFFESYFSNYIEGTEFEIEEAEQIVFEKHKINNRHQDSHDVLAVFDVVQDYTEMFTTPKSVEELLALLTQRHSLIMNARPEKRPGQLKFKSNKAGDTVFVAPDQIEGTFAQAFPIYQSLPEGLARAIFIQFLITECHPFDDGNGRLARIMMNAELVSAEEVKIIVPTVHRDSYLNGLRDASRNNKFRTITKVFSDLHGYTHSVEWVDYSEARTTLENHFAHKLPDQGVAVFNREISKYRVALSAG